MVYDRTLNGTTVANTINGDGRNEQINGLGGNDTLNGNGGSDRLDGGIGNDTLNGGDGDDILIGGAGTDTLTGGAGADLFTVSTSGGADTITDFLLGTDRIDLTAYGAYQSIVQSGADTLVTFAAGVTLRLLNVTAATVTDASFVGLPSPPAAPQPMGQPSLAKAAVIADPEGEADVFVVTPEGLLANLAEHATPVTEMSALAMGPAALAAFAPSSAGSDLDFGVPALAGHAGLVQSILTHQDTVNPFADEVSKMVRPPPDWLL